jgi:cellulose biosynthesis protein BcsQ
VRQIYTLPQVSWSEVVEAGWLAVNNERARRVAATPLRQAYSEPARARAVATGTRVIAFLSAKGGTGRSTVAEALGYELAVRNNLQTLLLSCDLPPAATMHLGLRYVPNAMEFIRRPLDGFNAAIQKYEKLDVITAPANSVEYALAVHSDGDKPSGLHGLLSATWTRNYAAVLLDLPPGEQPWTLEGIAAANTAIVVTRLTLADVAGTRHTLQLLVERMSAEHRIPREAIFLALNQVHDHAPLTPRTFLDALAKELDGWTPPVAAIIPRVDELPLKQDQGNPPTAALDDFAHSIRSIYKHLYPGMEPDTGRSEKKNVFRLFR